MHYFVYLFTLLSIVHTATNGVNAAVVSTPATDFAVVKSLPQIPQGWHSRASLPAGRRLRFHIAVGQENAFAFENHVIDISTPDHAKHVQHVNRDGLKVILRPDPDATTVIMSWPIGQGVPSEDVKDK
ncbi:vesicle formation at the endoplasmic reticulum, partial [Sticta canariensis]|nr:vesicle formation at the endoplasmic reticulum [Sticta canariensis]